MRLISEIMKKRLGLSQEFRLTHHYLQEIWHFYQVYNISLVIVGRIDQDERKKNNLMKKLIKSSSNGINFKVYGKMLEYMKKDIEVINLAFEFMEEKVEESDFFGDYDIQDCIAIGIYE